MKSTKRLACVCLTAVMSASLVAGNALAFANDSGKSNATQSYGTVRSEDVTGKVDLSAIAINNMTGKIEADKKYSTQNGKKTVIVGLDKGSLISGKPADLTVAEYSATRAGLRALNAIENQQEGFLNTLSLKGIGYTLKSRYNAALNAVAIEVASYDVDKLTKIEGVQSVVFSSSYAVPKAVETDENGGVINYSNVYETGIYNSSQYVKDGYDGSGVTVAILDTGLDYTHHAFSKMPDNVSLTKEDVARKLAEADGGFDAVKLSALKGNNIGADDLYVNAKVPFAYDYADKDADVYPSYSQHGTHVAGIVGGQDDSYTDKDGNVALGADGQPLKFTGVAPQSQLVICKVFTDDLESKDLGGAVTEDILAALDDCVKLDVDIINMSLGTSAGFSSVSIDGDTEGAMMNRVYGDIKKAGINLIAAASNEFSSGYGSAFGTNLASNPDSGTIGSPSTFTGAMSVASVNGQLARYMMVNGKPIYFEDASDANSVRLDFIGDMLGESDSATYKYVVVPGNGQPANFNSVRDRIKSLKEEGHKVIALILRGGDTFQAKILLAMSAGADGAIIRNNVAGSIRVSIGEIENPIPTVSITMDAGNEMVKAATGGVGDIYLDKSYQAGPFMNDYSSWGVTPDLQLKPDITAHGGEIISTVAGGYQEMSGTSMATPNLAGFAAILRSYLRNEKGITDTTELTRLSNALTMSTATTVYDADGLPYSPRKQGSGLATLKSVFTSNAYLYTDIKTEGDDPRDGRPKAELGEDESKNGVYSFDFYVKNIFGSEALSFKLQSIFFTETLSSDNLSVAEKARLLTDVPAQWKVDGTAVADDYTVTVNSGESKKITVTLTLSSAEKRYLNETFKNGMFVEGFIKLISQTEGQCDLTFPYMGFYGDWEQAPMLDYDCFQIAEFQKDSSYTDETRPKEQVWATQAYATYYNETFYIPMGSFMYVQDENAEQIYVEQEHAAVSMYNIDMGEESPYNYMTTTQIKALYAGLLRNAELVTYDLYDAQTGELIKKDNKYRANKAYAGGGSAVPTQILLELSPSELGLTSNGKYTLDFHFYFNQEDKDDPAKQNNTFSMTFYVDYEAPMLLDSRIRYYDYKDGNKDKQRVYLDLDIYDNHYAQSVLFCYSAKDSVDMRMVTEYVTPIYNSVFNGVNTVSIDITHLYDDKDALTKYDYYVQIDDYALNHTVRQLYFDEYSLQQTPATFSIKEDGRITTAANGNKQLTLNLNETYKVGLNYTGDANLSNFNWVCRSADGEVVVNNGELFAAKVTRNPVTVVVSNANGQTQNLLVTVVDANTALPQPTISFGDIVNEKENIVKASGLVSVNAGSVFDLTITIDPWYYNVVDSLKSKLKIKWSTTNEAAASINTQTEGLTNTVTMGNEKGRAAITAVLLGEDGKEIARTTVTLNIPDPFTVSNFTLTKFVGSEEVVVIPNDKNIMNIGDRAFYQNNTMKKVIIPKTVTTINERAFDECTALEEVYFISEEKKLPADSSLSTIHRFAFRNCSNLKKVDFSNVKTITLGRSVFQGCTSLEEVVDMAKVGTMNNMAFAGCTSLKKVDLSGLHLAGTNVFSGCTSLKEVKSYYFTDLGENMFSGCTGIEKVTISTPTVKTGAFRNCTSLKEITFEKQEGYGDYPFNIEAYAFAGCTSLTTVNFNGNKFTKIGDMAFEGCSKLAQIDILPDTVYGDSVFNGTLVNNEAVYNGDTLVVAPRTITADFAIKEGTKVIAPYAFAGCKFENDALSLPDSIIEIGEGAFAHSTIKSIAHFPQSVDVIAPYAFFDTLLESVVIPAHITEIGDGAFGTCFYLASVTFEEGSHLATLGDMVFANVRELTSITFPESLKTIGNGTFYNDDFMDDVAGTEYLAKLTEVVIPSVTSLGNNTFFGCLNLESVTFGENATDLGEQTFYPGHILIQTATGEYDIRIFESNLKSVSFGGGIKEIAARTFYYCTELTSIDLKNVTAVGDEAFAACSSLTSATGLENLTYIGDRAFADTALTALNLSSAKTIGEGAFFISRGVNAPVANAYTQVTLGNSLVSIGGSAFFGGDERTVAIPASVTSIGNGAFASSRNLTSIAVDSANTIFFSDNGVLYRNVKDFTTGATSYELVAYPSNRAPVASYRVLDNTTSIAGSAFYGLTASTIAEVVLPYSLKTIGSAAFYESGITTYNFEGIVAPTLLSDYFDNFTVGVQNLGVQYSLYYTNFEEEFPLYAGSITGYTPKALTIKYPKNAQGFDNYVYTNYFKNVVVGDEVAGDTVREIQRLISLFPTVETVNGYLNLEVNDTNKQTVKEVIDNVKEAHRLYNEITSETQLSILGSENFAKITAIEAALKPVKVKFNLQASISRIVAKEGTYKSAYLEGEKFDISGMKFIVTYDDYSTEEIDGSEMTLEDTEELTVNHSYVTFSGKGKTVRVQVTVTENPDSGQPSTGGCNSCSSAIDPIGGVAVLAALVIIALISKSVYKKRGDK